MTIALIEGIDRIGKSSCVNHLVEQRNYGYTHFGRPDGNNSTERAHFQKGTFDRMFKILAALSGQQVRLVFDRAHLGELVYGPMYRGDSGVDLSYIYEMESSAPFDDVVLILLYHRDLDVVRTRDDGLGFDISKIENEQNLFLNAFHCSRLRNKRIMDVTTMSKPDMFKSLDTIITSSKK